MKQDTKVKREQRVKQKQAKVFKSLKEACLFIKKGGI